MSSCRVLITGASGMLGHALLWRWHSTYQLFATARSRLAKLPAKVKFMPCNFELGVFSVLAEAFEPDVVVNCAALTDHALCQKDPEYAKLVNAHAVRQLAQQFPNAYFIHISTDAVFGAEQIAPDESVLPQPFSVYGKTKYSGEQELLAVSADSVVLRTTVVGLGGRRSTPSLVEWILHSLCEKREIGLFTDAIFTPITIWHLAELLEWCIVNRPKGIFHACGGQSISKHDFGVALAETMCCKQDLIKPSLLRDFEGAAERRYNQSLDSSKLLALRQIGLPTVRDCIQRIKEYYHEKHTY